MTSFPTEGSKRDALAFSVFADDMADRWISRGGEEMDGSGVSVAGATSTDSVEIASPCLSSVEATPSVINGGDYI